MVILEMCFLDDKISHLYEISARSWLCPDIIFINLCRKLFLLRGRKKSAFDQDSCVFFLSPSTHLNLDHVLVPCDVALCQTFSLADKWVDLILSQSNCPQHKGQGMVSNMSSFTRLI